MRPLIEKLRAVRRVVFCSIVHLLGNWICCRLGQTLMLKVDYVDEYFHPKAGRWTSVGVLSLICNAITMKE